MKLNAFPINARTIFYLVLIFSMPFLNLVHPSFFHHDSVVDVRIQGLVMTIPMIACVLLIREKFRTETTCYNAAAIISIVVILLGMTLIYFA